MGGAAVLLALIGVGGASAYTWVGWSAEQRLARTWPEVPGKDLPVPWPLGDAEIEALRQERLAALAAAAPDGVPDPAVDPMAGVDLAALAGERASARAAALLGGRLPCGECHGADGGGRLVADAQPVWTWYAPNITPGGVTRDYTPRDWDRIVRHGIRKDGTTATMPAVDFMSLSDREVSDLAWWYAHRPPIAAAQPPTVLGPVGKALIGLGQLPLSAEQIDHGRTLPAEPPPEAVTVEFGAHVAATCVGCHRTDYSGGPIAQGPPDWPPARNLTQAEDGLKSWTHDDFVRLFREGRKPDGTPVAAPMDAVARAKLGDVELDAMWMFLRTLEARPTGE